MIAVKGSWIIKRAWIILYLLCLMLPVAYSDYSDSVHSMYNFTGYFYGFDMFFMGMLEFISSLPLKYWDDVYDTMPWLANPLLLIASISLHIGKRYFFFIATISAFVFAGMYSINPVGYCCEDGRHILATPQVGYYVWLLSIFMLFVKGWLFFYPLTEPD